MASIRRVYRKGERIMEEKFVPIIDLGQKRERLLKEAEIYRENGEIAKALSNYNEFLNIGERFKDYSRHHEGYWGMYLTWYNHCLLCKNWNTLVEDLYNVALVYAPSEKQEEYKKIYNKNLKIFNQEISNK